MPRRRHHPLTKKKGRRRRRRPKKKPQPPRKKDHDLRSFFTRELRDVTGKEVDELWAWALSSVTEETLGDTEVSILCASGKAANPPSDPQCDFTRLVVEAISPASWKTKPKKVVSFMTDMEGKKKYLAQYLVALQEKKRLRSLSKLANNPGPWVREVQTRNRLSKIPSWSAVSDFLNDIEDQPFLLLKAHSRARAFVLPTHLPSHQRVVIHLDSPADVKDGVTVTIAGLDEYPTAETSEVYHFLQLEFPLCHDARNLVQFLMDLWPKNVKIGGPVPLEKLGIILHRNARFDTFEDVKSYKQEVYGPAAGQCFSRLKLDQWSSDELIEFLKTVPMPSNEPIETVPKSSSRVSSAYEYGCSSLKSRNQL